MMFKVWDRKAEKWLCSCDHSWWKDWAMAEAFYDLPSAFKVVNGSPRSFRPWSYHRWHIVPDSQDAEDKEGV